MKWFIKCLKQYADFGGRARRKEYWWFALINFIISIILLICWVTPIVKMGFDAAAAGIDDVDEMDIAITMLESPFLYIYLVYYLAVLIPSISVTVRRLHDIGRSGYWAFFIYGGSMLGSLSSYKHGPLRSPFISLFYRLHHLACLDVHRLAIWTQPIRP